jgi:hypothetical protein
LVFEHPIACKGGLATTPALLSARPREAHSAIADPGFRAELERASERLV